MNVNANLILSEEKKRQNLSNKQLSILADVPLPTVNNYFSKDAIASDGTQGGFETTYKLARALGVSLDGMCGIVSPAMGLEEIERIKAQYEGERIETSRTIDLFAQQAGFKDDLIAAMKETIDVLKQSRRTLRTAVLGLAILGFVLLVYALIVDANCAAVGLIRY